MAMNTHAMISLSSSGAVSGAMAFTVAGVGPRRAGTLSRPAVPAGGGLLSIKGGRLAVVAAAAAGAGDDSKRKETVAAVWSALSSGGALGIYGVGTRRQGMLGLAAPGRLPSSKRAQLAVVAAASSAQGPRDEDAPTDLEAVASSFRMELELFKMSPRPVQFDGPPDLLDLAASTAQKSIRLFECLLVNKVIDQNAYEELVLGGKSFVTVEGQCADGYVRSDALIHATQSVKLAGQVFFPSANLAVHTAVLSSDNVDRKAYLNSMLQAFVMYYSAVAWEAHDAYGFKMTGGP